MTTLQQFMDAFSDDKLLTLIMIMISKDTGECTGDQVFHISELVIENYNAEFDRHLSLHDVTPHFLNRIMYRFTIALITTKLVREGNIQKIDTECFRHTHNNRFRLN
jgi:hypothetical protein